MFKTITKDIIITIGDDFQPAIRFGNSVRPGTVLGKGKISKIVQEFPLNLIEDVLVEDGTFVKKDTKLATTKGLFETIILTADYDGLVRLTPESVQIVQIVDDHEYKSLFTGRIKSLTPKKIVIEAKFIAVPVFASKTSYKVRGKIQSILPKNSLVTTTHLKNIKNNIVAINSPLSTKIAETLYRKGTKLIIAPSIDINDYSLISQRFPALNFAILQSFGNYLMWKFYVDLFKQAHTQYAILPENNRSLLINYFHYDIDMGYIYTLSDNYWLKEIETLPPKNEQQREQLYKELNAIPQEVFGLKG